MFTDETLCYLCHPAGQERDLEGRTDLLAQARRGEDEGLIAVRLQHNEVTCHGWILPSLHCAVEAL